MSARKATPESKNLRQELEEILIAHFQDLQENELHPTAWQLLLDLSNPRSAQNFEQSSLAFKRMARYHAVIRKAQADGRVLPWIYLPGAAMTFEGIYASTAMLWMSTPLPNNETEVAKPVKEYLSLQVGAFVAAITGVEALSNLWCRRAV